MSHKIMRTYAAPPPRADPGEGAWGEPLLTDPTFDTHLSAGVPAPEKLLDVFQVAAIPTGRCRSVHREPVERSEGAETHDQVSGSTITHAALRGHRNNLNSTLDIYSMGRYYGFMATSISDNATFLRVVVRKDFLKTIRITVLPTGTTPLRTRSAR
jgi:hypothetical protein